MDSSVVVLENCSGFFICSTRVGTLPSYATSAALDPKSGDTTIVLLLNFGGILQQKLGSAVEYAQLYIYKKKQKDVWIFTKMCPTRRAKNMFRLVDFLV